MAKNNKKSGPKGENVVFGVLIAVASVGAIACFIIGGIAFFNGRGSTAGQSPRQSQAAQTVPPSNAATPAPTNGQNEPQTDSPSQPQDNEPGSQRPQGNLGDYSVEIKGASIGEDYNGNPIIVVTYSWTNNSDETKAAAFTLLSKAFQDGVELENAIVANSELYDSGASIREIRPGATLDVQSAFVMTSNSIVEFELSKLISFSNDIVAMSFDPTKL